MLTLASDPEPLAHFLWALIVIPIALAATIIFTVRGVAGLLSAGLAPTRQNLLRWWGSVGMIVLGIACACMVPLVLNGLL